MKYICGYKTYVKYGRVCFNTLIGCEEFPTLQTELLTNNANQREEEGKLKNE